MLRRLDPDLDRLRVLEPHLRAVLPPEPTRNGGFVPDRRLRHAGLDLGVEEALAHLNSIPHDIDQVFKSLRDDPAINGEHAGESFLHNGQFPTPDAELYASFIQARAPNRIVEVGAGFSTLIARRTIDLLGLDTTIVVIDPEPRTDVEGAADEVIRAPVEATTLSIDGRDLLFIDSSHATRPGGDVPHLFNEVVPSLPTGVAVHVHDVFLPWDYPAAYHARLYTEQYVLQALLTYATRFRTLFATHYMVREHGEAMRDRFGEICGRDEYFFGASYWFEVD